ncbi:transcriptional regulator TACO1-like protein [Mycena olivaceomarginata]|nr:transcriptional regulator TACO1-like protein [Mycena olivaceomarginata]
MILRSNIHGRVLALRSFCSTPPSLSGHNKWSKIKEKKGINDVKKNAAYTKASREIMTAVRRKSGGSADPEQNSALAAILRRLKDIPKENIQNALEKAVKKRDQRGEAIVYEALAYNKVGLIIECATPNPTRTVANIRHILSEHNAHITPVRFMFNRIGSVKAIAKNDELALITLIDIAMDNGAEDVQENLSTDTEVEFQVRTGFFQVNIEMNIRNSLPATGIARPTHDCMSAPGVCQTLLASEIVFAPFETDNTVGEEDPDMATKISDLVRELEDDEDTKRVWTSWTA